MLPVASLFGLLIRPVDTEVRETHSSGMTESEVRVSLDYPDLGSERKPCGVAALGDVGIVGEVTAALEIKLIRMTANAASTTDNSVAGNARLSDAGGSEKKRNNND